MYVKKSDVEYWVNQLMEDLHRAKTENSYTYLQKTYDQAFGQITILYYLQILTKEQWKKLHDQIFAIAYE